MLAGKRKLHDLAATLLTCAGYSRRQLDDLMPQSMCLCEPGDACRDHAVCMYRTSSIDDRKLYWDPGIEATMFRTGEYKLNAYHSPRRSNESIQGQLFHMTEDPLELTNLWDSGEYEDVKHDLLGRLMNWFVENDRIYHGSRGGGVFPEKSQWSLNNPL